MYRRWMGEPGCPTAFTGHRDIAAKGTGPSRNPGRSSATRRKSDPAGQRIDNRSHGDHRDLSHTALHRSSGRQATGLRANVGRGFDLSARPDRRSLHPIDRCPISRRNLSRSFRALPDRRVLPFHVNRLGILPIPSGKTPTLTLTGSQRHGLVIGAWFGSARLPDVVFMQPQPSWSLRDACPESGRASKQSKALADEPPPRSSLFPSLQRR